MMVRRATPNSRGRAEMLGRWRELPTISRMRFCRHGFRLSVPGLTKTELAAAWKGERRDQAVPSVLDWVACNMVFLQLFDERMQVVAHQEELVHVIPRRRVHGKAIKREASL